MRFFFFSILSILFSIFPVSVVISQSSTLLETEIERIQFATVFVYQVQDVGDDFFITCVGSGTILSRDGLVLTNAHNTQQSDGCPGDTLVIALTTRIGEPPVPLYRATLLQFSPGLDLALLQIDRSIDGRRLLRDDLAFPFVELGDSSRVALDDTVVMVGYTSLSGDSVEVVRGTVSSFTEEPIGDKSWLKISSSVPGLMSGGGAYDSSGRLIGIPTTTPPSGSPSLSDCRFFQDTNGDRLVNSADVCVPVGGFINALRASNFARSLFRAASLGLRVDLSSGDSLSSTVSPPPKIDRLFFSSSVTEARLPSAIVASLPTGTSSLYLFFDYANMTQETIFELRVTINNIPNPVYSLAPVRWSGGESGTWYIGSSDQVWENGVYDFTIFINGVAESTANIVIGGASTESPTISDIVFGLSDLDGTPLGNGYVLPTGNIASARYIYRNMTSDVEVTERWFYEGAEVYRNSSLWDTTAFGPDGARTISIQDAGGLLPGRYRLELYLDGRLAATSDFTIAGSPQGAFPEVFVDAHFVTAQNAEDAIEAPASNNFTTEIDTLYALFNWQQIQPGTFWTVRWSVDDEVFFERTQRWNGALSGDNFLLTLRQDEAIPDGTYRMDLFIDRVQLASVEATVGIGQLPIDRFAQASGLQLRGNILDVDTGQGIPGVTFVLISEDYSVADFTWDAEQIYATATTDRNGFFQMDRLLEISDDTRTIPYSVVISAEGYLPVEADGFVVTEETENPLELTIYLTRE